MSDKKTDFKKIRVGVFMGGKSIEREVSFNSGRTICDHLDTTKYEVIPIFQTESGDIYLLPWHFLHRGKISDFFDRLANEAEKIIWDDLKKTVDFVYLAIHGRFAEDGTAQGFLEVLDIPYLGTKVFGSALGMNKSVQKIFLQKNKIDVARDIVLTPNQIKKLKLEQILEKLEKQKINFPVIIKPVHEGSSFGINVAFCKEELLSAIKKASSCDSRFEQEVLVEEKLEGMEFVCACLQRVVLPRIKMPRNDSEWFALSLTEVVPEEKSGFYDYVQKYMPGRAKKITPARCSKKDYEKIIKTCIRASQALEFSTISRIDGFLTKDGRVVVIDPNSLTGMAPATFLFHQAAEIGMSHTQLINYLIETELQNYGLSDLMKNSEKEVENNKNKKRIVVLLGGNNSEREISLESGRNICYKLSPHKYEIIPVFVDNKKELYRLSQKLLIQNSTHEISELLTNDIKIQWSQLPNICDFVFIALHGGVGENGSVQGTLQMLGLPFNGSGVFTSGLCIDKYKTSGFLKTHGLDVPWSELVLKSELTLRYTSQCSALKVSGEDKNLNFPLIVKPHDDGCSFFVEKVNNQEELSSALDDYFKDSNKDSVLIEEFINATELTVGVFGNEEITVLPPSKVLANKDILSIEEKFLPGAGENLTPAPLPENAIKLIQDIVGKTYKTLGCKGYARIDCFYQSEKQSPTKKERVIILEVNTLPGMTPATCIFHQAAEIGLRPMEFIDRIVELGIEEHKILNVKKDVETVAKR